MGRTKKSRIRRSRCSSTNSHLELDAAREAGKWFATKARCEPRRRRKTVVVSGGRGTSCVDDSHCPVVRRVSCSGGYRASKDIAGAVEVNEETKNDDDNDDNDNYAVDDDDDDDDDEEEDIEERSRIEFLQFYDLLKSTAQEDV